jgi:Na+/H+ antiporter NhaD/arsenite permease-like protein
MLLSPSIGAASHPTEAWLTLAMASTFAGNLTIVGSIANLIVAEISRKEGQPIGFLEYLKVGVPLTLSSTAVGIAVLAVQRP